MKKTLMMLILAIFVMSLVLTGCGPKKASDEQLTQLEELKNAADAAEAQCSDCEAKINDLNAKIADLEKEIEGLKTEIEKYK